MKPSPPRDCPSVRIPGPTANALPVLALGLALLTAGCGNRGPLYLPDDAQRQATSASNPVANPPEDLIQSDPVDDALLNEPSAISSGAARSSASPDDDNSRKENGPKANDQDSTVEDRNDSQGPG